MEKKLNKEQIISCLKSNDQEIREASFGYIIRDIVENEVSDFQIAEILNYTDTISTEEKDNIICKIGKSITSAKEIQRFIRISYWFPNQLQYLGEILNSTQNPVENESLNAILVGADGEVLGQMQTWIQSLAVGEEYDISVVLNGNLTGTQSIQLQPVNN